MRTSCSRRTARRSRTCSSRRQGAASTYAPFSGARTATAHRSARRRTSGSAATSTTRAEPPCSTNGYGAAARTIRSSSWCATVTGRATTSRSSAASTCATPGATTAGITGTGSDNRWIAATAPHPRGTTRCWRSAGRRCSTCRSPSRSGGTTRRRSTIATRIAECSSDAPTCRARPARCLRSRRLRLPPARIACRCCGPTPPSDRRSRSRRAGSAASPAPMRERSPAPAASSTSRTSTSGPTWWRRPSPRRCVASRACG